MGKKLTKRDKEKQRMRTYTWSADRGELIKNNSFRIANRLNLTLIEDEGVFYMEQDGKRSFLCKPADPKKKWLEVCNILRQMLPESERYMI
jgi:hypothetical protein